jgi:hypothetical protein
MLEPRATEAGREGIRMRAELIERLKREMAEEEARKSVRTRIQ